MRVAFTAIVAGLVSAAVVAAQGAGGKVEVKGPHVCCKSCVRAVEKVLSNVPGVSAVEATPKNRTVVFTAKDDAAARAGLKALIDGGFFGEATLAGQPLPADAASPAKGTKADVVTVKNVHVCCGQCQNAINKLFKEAKVSYEGSGAQRTVRLEGKDLDPGEVVEALRKGGFNGTAEK